MYDILILFFNNMHVWILSIILSSYIIVHIKSRPWRTCIIWLLVAKYIISSLSQCVFSILAACLSYECNMTAYHLTSLSYIHSQTMLSTNHLTMSLHCDIIKHAKVALSDWEQGIWQYNSKYLGLSDLSDAWCHQSIKQS